MKYILETILIMNNFMIKSARESRHRTVPVLGR